MMNIDIPTNEIRKTIGIAKRKLLARSKNVTIALAKEGDSDEILNERYVAILLFEHEMGYCSGIITIVEAIGLIEEADMLWEYANTLVKQFKVASCACAQRMSEETNE